MDQNPQGFSDQERQTMYNKLADLTAKALNTNSITEEQARHSSEFILDRLEAVRTKAELIEFLRELGARWDVFQEAFFEVKKNDLIGKVELELHALTQAQ